MWKNPTTTGNKLIEINPIAYAELIAIKSKEFKQEKGMWYCTKHQEHVDDYCKEMCKDCVKE